MVLGLFVFLDSFVRYGEFIDRGVEWGCYSKSCICGDVCRSLVYCFLWFVVIGSGFLFGILVIGLCLDFLIIFELSVIFGF